MTATQTDSQKQRYHFQVRVYYADTDAAAVVYHSNYLNFAERARTEMLRAEGLTYPQIFADFDMYFVMRRAEVDYLAPAKLDDLLDIETQVIEMRSASMTMKQIISCNDKVLAQISAVLVAVGSSGKPVRIPPQLRQILGR